MGPVLDMSGGALMHQRQMRAWGREGKGGKEWREGGSKVGNDGGGEVARWSILG